MSRSLELAERALEAAGRLGDGAQATVTSERSLLLRFARSRPTQATALSDTSVELTVLRDGHAGTATTNRTSSEALRACVERADAAARAAAGGGPGPYPGLPAPAPEGARRHDGHDPDTSRLDPRVGGSALRAAFDEATAQGVEAHGAWTAAEVETAVASTAGVAAADRVTDALMKVTCLAPSGRSGFDCSSAVAVSDIDPAALARRAASTAAANGGATELAPGEYPVVLERHAVADLLSWLGSIALNGLAYVEDRSALCGRLGSRVASPAVNLSDSPRFPRTLPRAFDAEGVPKRPLPLIEDGVARRVVHDTRSATLAGSTTTGHARAAACVGDGPEPTNMVLAGGGASGEAELCRPIERGVYVTRLWYTNAVRPKEALLTGVTRDGTFLIEHGEVTRPLRDLRFTDGVLSVLAGVQDLGARPQLTSDGELYGRRFASGVVCPPVRAAAMRFTGLVA